MRTTKTKMLISKSLEEVWEWKQKVYEEIRGKTFVEKKKLYQEAMEEAAKILNAKLIKNSDGTYCFI